MNERIHAAATSESIELAERGDAVTVGLFTEGLASHIHDRLRVARPEFRVPLESQDVIADPQHIVGTEFVPSQ